MSYITNSGTIDPNGYLCSGAARECLSGAEPTADQVGAINDAIASWAERDPEGYSEQEARRLDSEIAAILA